MLVASLGPASLNIALCLPAGEETVPLISLCASKTCVVDCIVAGRDASEDVVRMRLLELELKLLQTENEIVSASLGRWARGDAGLRFRGGC